MVGANFHQTGHHQGPQVIGPLATRTASTGTCLKLDGCQFKSHHTNLLENLCDFMVQVQKDMKKLTHDLLDYLELVEVSGSNMANSTENAVLMESKLVRNVD